MSDVHVDFAANLGWVADISLNDHQGDILILAGDISDDLRQLADCLRDLARRFLRVLYVPGNHDLWVLRDRRDLSSLGKFDEILAVAADCGVSMVRHDEPGLSIVPLLSWYDFSFGSPSEELRQGWMDFAACRWPAGMAEDDVTTEFLRRNPAPRPRIVATTVITFSHFLPRPDLLPPRAHQHGPALHPVLGARRLDDQVRAHGASIHVYGHSHVNRHVRIDDVVYINNALGYPRETAISARALRCIHAT